MSEYMATSSPLLRSRQRDNQNGGSRPATLSRLLSRAAGRRAPSMLVRDTAARELEERRADWGYSKPVVALDMMWNLAFVVVSAVILVCTLDERPTTPIRFWICGYALQSGIHVVLVWLEYRNRTVRRARDEEMGEESDGNGSDYEDEVETMRQSPGSRSSVVKRCETINTMASFLWWIVGFYWIVVGGEFLLRRAPRLYWLSVAFLAFDVFFAIFCVVLACLIGIALCCCLPCILAILYAVADQEGASDVDLGMLPRYRFRIFANEKKASAGAGIMVPVDTGRHGSSVGERVLSIEDSECCICLISYENGAEIHALPCNHHFHRACIVKWLRMNATCPLCKYNILQSGDQS